MALWMERIESCVFSGQCLAGLGDDHMRGRLLCSICSPFSRAFVGAAGLAEGPAPVLWARGLRNPADQAVCPGAHGLDFPRHQTSHQMLGTWRLLHFCTADGITHDKHPQIHP